MAVAKPTTHHKPKNKPCFMALAFARRKKFLSIQIFALYSPSKVLLFFHSCNSLPPERENSCGDRAGVPSFRSAGL